MWNRTFCEPFDEQLTGLGKMGSFCLTQNLLLNKQMRERGNNYIT